MSDPLAMLLLLGFALLVGVRLGVRWARAKQDIDNCLEQDDRDWGICAEAERGEGL